MTDKRDSSRIKTIPFDLKKGGALVVILALLILGANAILTEYGTPLPDDVVNVAEDIVTDAQTPDLIGTETPPTPNVAPPAVEETATTPWMTSQ